MKKTTSKTSVPLWIQIATLCLTVTLIGFFVLAYFKTPSPTAAQSDLVRFLYPLLAGFAASFISGGLLLFVNFPRTGGARLALSASAGLAIFIFVYLRPPYWYPGISPAPAPSPSPAATPASSPAVPAVTPVRPPVAAATSTPQPITPPAQADTAPISQNASLTPQPTPSPAPPRLPVQRAGKVLLLVDDETILQTMMQKLADYGLRVMSGHEYGEAESLRIRAALPQLRGGNPGAADSIPFAVVVTGRVSNTPIGEVQGSYLVESTAFLDATLIPEGQILLREKVTQKGGGRALQDATRSALREVAANIPEIFYRQIMTRAR